MTEKFRNKYRVKSHRMPGWDYSGDGNGTSVNSKIDDYIDEQGFEMPKYNRNNHFFQPNLSHSEALTIMNFTGYFYCNHCIKHHKHIAKETSEGFAQQNDASNNTSSTIRQNGMMINSNLKMCNETSITHNPRSVIHDLQSMIHETFNKTISLFNIPNENAYI